MAGSLARPEPLAYRLSDAGPAIGISERQFRDLYVVTGRIVPRRTSPKRGSAVLVLRSDLEKLLNSLPTEVDD